MKMNFINYCSFNQIIEDENESSETHTLIFSDSVFKIIIIKNQKAKGLITLFTNIIYIFMYSAFNILIIFNL